MTILHVENDFVYKLEVAIEFWDLEVKLVDKWCDNPADKLWRRSSTFINNMHVHVILKLLPI